MLPIADGVNDGEWHYWTDGLVEFPTYVVARTEAGPNRSAEIRPAPGEAWPFMWRLRAADVAVAVFRLDQFVPYRHPAFGYRVRAAGVQPALVNGFFIGLKGPTDDIGSCTSVATSTWTADACAAMTPYNQAFDYDGGVNGMFLSIRFPALGGVVDFLDVNYAYLTIAP